VDRLRNRSGCQAGRNEHATGRFVSAVTCGVRFVGVCIPWRDAHVRNGRRDAEGWQEHLAFCAALERVLDRLSNQPEPICLLGDFNQRIPRTFQPLAVFEALRRAIPDGFMIATAGLQDREGKNLIDHIAASPVLEPAVAEILPRFAADGTRLSDHVGVVVSLVVPE